MATVPSPGQLSYQQSHFNETRIPDIIASNVVCLSLACIAVALRFYSRRIKQIRYEADDWLILGGLVGPRLLLQSPKQPNYQIVTDNDLVVLDHGVRNV